MSPDLGEMWRQGCPKSPEWEGELELGSADEDEVGDNVGSEDENEDEGLEDFLKQVIESPLWVLVRDFLSSADVLEMRTTGAGTVESCGVPSKTSRTTQGYVQQLVCCNT